MGEGDVTLEQTLSGSWYLAPLSLNMLSLNNTDSEDVSFFISAVITKQHIC